MADISLLNVGGSDYNVKDATSRTMATNAMSLPAYYETGNTASQAYSIIGTPINWKGKLYYTKTAVAKGATWTVGTNLTAATNLGKLVRNIKTYVGSDSKLHFVDLTGADTALNFSSGPDSNFDFLDWAIVGADGGLFIGRNGSTKNPSKIYYKVNEPELVYAYGADQWIRLEAGERVVDISSFSASITIMKIMPFSQGLIISKFIMEE